MEDPDLIVVCMPVAAKKRVVAGSGQTTCSRCGALVWVAPTSLKVIADRNVVPAFLCFPGCAQADAAERGIDLAEAMAAPTPEQIAEIIKDDLR